MGLVRRLALAAAVAALVGCGGHQAAPPAPRAAPLVSVGRPTPPQHVGLPRGGTIELAAPPAARSPGFRLAVLSTPGGDPRDLCVAALPAGALYIEASYACDVRVHGSPAVFVTRPSLPRRPGAEPTVVAGVAPPGVGVVLEGPGGRLVLPLSRHRAFLAVYGRAARGPVRLVAGKTVRSFSLPLRHDLLTRHRRHGAVFADEIGERNLRSSYAAILRRFGPPAARGRHRGRRCLNYAVVGEGPGGWWLCFSAGGRMVSASHAG